MLIKFKCGRSATVPTTVATPTTVPTTVTVPTTPVTFFKPTPLSEFIIRHEGLRLTAYLDAADVPTIGYGHTATVTRADVGRRTITRDEAYRLLLQDLKWASMSAYAITGYSSGHIHDAIASFVFNLGPGALHGEKTRIGYHLINKDYTSAYYGMQKYVFGGGRRLNGLITRRKEEGDMLLGTK